jgi:hypothetical protein
MREVTANKTDLGLHPLRKYAYRPYLQGGSVTMDPAGERIYVLDDDRGELVVVDLQELTTQRRTKICDRPEQVVVAPSGSAFVTCRGDGRVVEIDAKGNVAASIFLGHEPYGIALTPTGRSVLVTTVTEPRVHALSTKSLKKLWVRDLPPEPRGVAISADGTRATVAHLRGGVASVVDVQRGYTAASRLPNLRDGWPSELFEDADVPTDRRVAGGSFAVASSPGGTRAFVPYVLKNDGSKIEEFAAGCYANGADLPLAASVAAIDFKTGQVQRPTPRLLAPGEDGGGASFWGVSELGLLGVVRAAFHDPIYSRLFAVGEGSGKVIAFDTSKADPTSSVLEAWQLGAPAKGLVVDPKGKRLIVHLAFQDELAIVPLDGEAAQDSISLKVGEETQLQLGRRLFYTSNDHKLAGFTGVSCSSCHLDGRSDGVTWRLDGKPLQTPSLAGRNFSAKSLRWHGDSPNLEHAIGEAITRLRGSGLSPDEGVALVAYLKSGAGDMRKPAADASRARGQTVFADSGCTMCHNPKTDYTDGQTHAFRNTKVRTPSLIGLALSAPYYHDGSMTSLAQLIRAHEEGNPMAVGKELPQGDLVDLERFLKSL